MDPNQNPDNNPQPNQTQPVYGAQPPVSPQPQMVQPEAPQVVSPTEQNVTQAPQVPLNPTPPSVFNQSPQAGVVGSGGVVSEPIQQPVYPQATGYPGPKKSLLKPIIAGGIVVVLAVVGFVAFSQFTKVSKADYRKADSTMSDVVDAYNKIGSVYPSSTSTATEIANDSQKITQARSDFKTKFDELGKLKAIKHDKDLKTQYQAVVTQLPKFDAAMDALLEAYSKILPIVSDYSQTALSSGDLSGKIAPLQKEFASITGLKDENNKAFVSNMSSLLSQYESLAVKVQAGRNDYKQYDSNVVNDFYATSTKISNAVRDWQSNLTKQADQGDLYHGLQKLEETLITKS